MICVRPFAPREQDHRGPRGADGHKMFLSSDSKKQLDLMAGRPNMADHDGLDPNDVGPCGLYWRALLVGTTGYQRNASLAPPDVRSRLNWGLSDAGAHEVRRPRKGLWSNDLRSHASLENTMG
jgi:hypothetical protein